MHNILPSLLLIYCIYITNSNYADSNLTCFLGAVTNFPADCSNYSSYSLPYNNETDNSTHNIFQQCDKIMNIIEIEEVTNYYNVSQECICLNNTAYQEEYKNYTEPPIRNTKIMCFEATVKTPKYANITKAINIRHVTRDEGEVLEISLKHATKAAVSAKYEICCYTNSFMADSILEYNTSSVKALEIEVNQNKAATHYWCEGFSETANITSDIVLAQHSELKVHHFILAVHSLSNYTEVSLSNITNLHSIEILSVPPYYPNEYSNITFHIRTCFENNTQEEVFEELSTVFEMLNDTLNYTLGSSTTCYGVNESTQSFPSANLGEIVVPKFAWLLKDGTPVKRKCGGNYLYGAAWMKVDLSNLKEPPYLIKHLQALEDMDSVSKALDEIQELFKNKTQDPYIVHLAAKVLRSVSYSHEAFDLQQFTNIMDSIMILDKSTLYESQNLFNTTDIILDSFDQALIKNGNKKLDYSKSIVESNVAAHIVNLNTIQLMGVGYYEENGKIVVRNFTKHTPFNDVRFAAYLEKFPTLSKKYPNYFVSAVFKTNLLFNPVKTKDRVITWVGSLSLSNNTFLNGKVTLVLKPFRNYRRKMYFAYWYYGLDSVWESIRGQWIDEGDPKNNNSHLVYQVRHLTHFTILLDGLKDAYTNIFTLVGCGCSLLGITGIFVSSAMSKKQRSNKGTWILVNFSFSILLQMLVLYPNDLIDSEFDESLCILVGVTLHYTLLSQFSWMFVIGYLQYCRFVVVLTCEPKRLLLKSCIIAWILPIIPVIITALISQKSYITDEYCYLSGRGLYFGALLPICVILIINLYIFCRILVSISCKRSNAYGTKNNTLALQVKLGVMLFFVLGLSWVFGLLAGFFESPALSYLFCLTSTLQGFVLFVYFVILNKNCK